MAGIESKFNAIILRLGKLRCYVGSSHYCLASCISGSVGELQYRVYSLEIRAADLHNITSVMLFNLGRISYPKLQYVYFHWVNLFGTIVDNDNWGTLASWALTGLYLPNPRLIYLQNQSNKNLLS
jgi:hypothetical protein